MRRWTEQLWSIKYWRWWQSRSWVYWNVTPTPIINHGANNLPIVRNNEDDSFNKSIDKSKDEEALTHLQLGQQENQQPQNVISTMKKLETSYNLEETKVIADVIEKANNSEGGRWFFCMAMQTTLGMSQNLSGSIVLQRFKYKKLHKAIKNSFITWLKTYLEAQTSKWCSFGNVLNASGYSRSREMESIKQC